MIIFHNPHTKIGFGQTFADFIYRSEISKKSQKYKFLLDYLNNNEIKFGIFIDFADSTLPLFLRKKIFIYLEVILWIFIKKLSFSNIKIISKLDKIHKNDIFFSFSWNTLDSNYNGVDDIANKEFIKIFHLTHIHQQTSLIVKNFNKLNIDFIIAENNLQNSDYFQYHFKNYNKNVYTLPFTYGKKYIKKIDFKNRINKCLSIGAIINIYDYNIFDDFYAFFKVDTLQPIRKEIYIRKNEFSKQIKCKNSIFKVDNELKLGFIKKYYKKIKRLLVGTKNKCFNYDRVKELNKYKMFINGEELNGLPSIGFIEGMACGSAYIGVQNSMYTDIGLIPGYHYISHNGTIDDIINKINYYKIYNNELEKIALNGYNFVRKNFNQISVAKKFYNDLLKLEKKYKQNILDKNKLTLNCSFIKNVK